MNDLLLRALRCEQVERPPVWIMRQAGRYLPEYRALRAKHSFHELVHTPTLAAQVTHLPIDIFGMDAAILFSDILVLPEIFGFKMEFTENQGMKLLSPSHDIALSLESTLHFVPETIQLLKKTLPVPLIGFCGGPYTVCRYMERLTPEWLDQVTTASISYLKLQIAAGVDAIQIFDSWAGLLSSEDFNTLALPYLKTLIDAIKPHNIPIILFMRGSSRYIPELISLAPNCLSVDWETDLATLRQTVPSHIALQGNLNPSFLNGPLSSLQPAVLQLLSSMQNSRGFIFNLGHGIEPEARLENVRWLIDHIKQKVR